MFLFFAFLPSREKGILIAGYRDIVSIATGYVIISLKILVFGRFAIDVSRERKRNAEIYRSFMVKYNRILVAPGMFIFQDISSHYF